jgi:hypothetical protein
MEVLDQTVRVAWNTVSSQLVYANATLGILGRPPICNANLASLDALDVKIEILAMNAIL